MLKPTIESESSPEKVAPKLFVKESFAMKVKALADELFADERWVDLYSDVGKPARSPKVMVTALILQRHRNLSDGQMSSATRFDLEIKAALGLAWDDPGIPKTCFCEFRKRLLEYGKECEVFNAVNQMLVEKKVIRKKEAVYIDASHVEAAASTPNPPQLIRKATTQVLRNLKAENPKLYKQIKAELTPPEELCVSRDFDYFMLPEAERNERFAEAAGDARKVIAGLKRKKVSAKLKANAELLDLILDERATEDDEPIDPDDAPPGRTANHRDTDARWGAKGKEKYFFGYKRTIVTNKDGMIVTFGVDPGNTPDGAVLDTLVEDAQELFGVTPEKIVGDAAYGSVDNHRKMKAKGIQLVATLKPAPNPRGKFSGDRFTFNSETQSLACPGGKATTDFHASPDGEGKVFRFDLLQCLSCPVRDDCTTGDFRSVKVKETIPDLQDALTYGKTADYRQDMKDRAAIEGKHSEAVRYHGGRRSPYVGIDRVFLGEAFRCAVLNLKRFFKLAERQMNPAWG